MKNPAALWCIAEGSMEWRPAVLPPAPPPGHLRLRTLASGISRGTERLVLSGQVPETERQRMRAPMQQGEFPFPVLYGYSCVGEDETGRRWFALAPHQSLTDVPHSLAVPLPEGVPLARCVLAANMETALNALWDAAVGPGDRIFIVGAGIVGALVAALASRLPGAEVTMIDPDPSRQAVAAAFGCAWQPACLPEQAGSADVVFHASASSAGLAAAIGLAGQEATVVELSWYGSRDVFVPLGGQFHAGRIRLVSSQVGQVAASRRPRWDFRRRLAKAASLLTDGRLDCLCAPPVPAAEAADRVPELLMSGSGGPAPWISYDDFLND